LIFLLVWFGINNQNRKLRLVTLKNPETAPLNVFILSDSYCSQLECNFPVSCDANLR